MTATVPSTVYEANLTHNLTHMARAAGIYQHLWRPEELQITHAAQLIGPLQTGLALLKSDPDTFKRLNPPNGWGDYEGFVKVVSDYLEMCIAYPQGEIRVDR